MASIHQGYKGHIDLAFDYRQTPDATPIREEIETERITYVMIERLYENIRILPVIYVSLNVKADMYRKIIDTNQTSTFYLRIRKRNALSSTSVLSEVANDNFQYVVTTGADDYASSLLTNATRDNAYKSIIIGLVSPRMIAELRTPFNDIYHNISQEQLIRDEALKGLKKVIMEPLTKNVTFKNILITPVASRYKLLKFLFERKPFYNSMFTFFMDFKNTYLISKNGNAVDAKDGKPSNVIIRVQDFSAADAYKDGFSIENGAYVINVNAADTNPQPAYVTDKSVNNIVGYDDNEGVQDLHISDQESNRTTNFVRSKNAAALKNEILNSRFAIEILKQNADPDIFTPNKSYYVSNYGVNSKYDGKYILNYKKEFYYFTQGNEFTITTNICLKLTQGEETASAKEDTVLSGFKKNSSQKTRKSSSKKVSSNVKAGNRKAVNKSKPTSSAHRKKQ